MNDKLSLSYLKGLNSDNYENFLEILDADLSISLEWRILLFEKIGHCFLPTFFVPHKYPLEKVINLFSKVYSSNNETEIITALSFFSYIDLKIARELALRLLDHSNVEVRAEAICSLGYCQDKDDVNLLWKLLNLEGNNLILSEIYVSLLRLGDLNIIQKFDDFLNIKDEKAISEFIVGLTTLIDNHNFLSLVPRLKMIEKTCKLKVLKDDISDFFLFQNRKDIKLLIEKLTITNELDVKELLNYFSHQDAFVRFIAIEKFGGGDYPNKNILPKNPPNKMVFEEIRKLYSDDNADVRAEVLSVLSDWKKSEDVGIFINSLNDEAEIVRICGIYAFGEVGNVSLLPSLLDQKNKIRTSLEKVRFYQACIRLGQGEYFNDWLCFLEDNEEMVRLNVVGGVWSIINEKNRDELISKLKKRLLIETHLNVFNEIERVLNQFKY